MKRLYALLLGLALCIALFGAALAGEQTDLTGKEAGFLPFAAQTNELAVNIRSEANEKSEKSGRIERGQILTVTGETTDKTGALWYSVLLEDGTAGFVRSDLLLEADADGLAGEDGQSAERQLPPEEQSAEIAYIGNRNTKKFHVPECRTLPAAKNQVKFSLREEAVSEGYIPCKNCEP